jgi:monovalent cation/hydrogen antiporter
MTGQVGFALAALACVLVAAPLGRRLRVPSAVLLVLVGLAYGLAPGPNVRLDPSVVLTLVIPPLLYSTALRASLLEIRSHLRTVGSLSIGLVLATTFAVAGLLVLAVPGLPFSVAVALGAAVSPPDPVAALAIGRRAGLPPRLITLVEGEGLLNDATALTTYQIALAAAAGSGVTALTVAGSLFLEVSVGLAVGLAVAFAVRVLRRHITDPLVDNGLSLGIPFLSYTLAHALHGSGVLAVVVAGLVIGHSSSQISTGASRLQTRAVWRLVDFLLEGFVFLLIGQQLPKVIDGLGSYRISTLVAAAGIAVGVTVLLRPIWLLVTTHLPGRLRGTSDVLRAKEVLALSWVGTRGVITLAAVFGLPLTLHGQPLPRRDLLLFCAYAVVLVTLVGQGLTFGPLLDRLGLPTGGEAEQRSRLEARLAAAKAGADRLEEIIVAEAVPTAVAERARRAAEVHVARRAATLDRLADGAGDDPTGDVARLRRLLIDAEREELLRWRDAGRLSDRGLRALDRELDVEEGRPR